MVLSELRSLISNKINYDPEVEAYQREVDRLINEAQHALASDRPWPFLQKEVRVIARADVTATDGTVTNGSSNVTTTAAFFTQEMRDEGAELIGPDGQVYEVLNFNSTTDIDLRTPYQGATVVGTASLRVVWRYLRLPEDVMTLLQVGHRPLVASASRENQRFVPLTKREDEFYELDLDLTGDPDSWIPAFDDHIKAPVKTPVLGTVAGAWSAGTYEIAYSFVRQGMESSLSPSAQITLTGAQSPTVTIYATGTGTGTKKKIYVRPISKGTALTPLRAYYWTLATQSETTTATTLALPLTETIVFGDRALENAGKYKRIRLYPRPATDIEVAVRYQRRIPLLLEDQDDPVIPAEHHGYLSSYALIDLYLKHDLASHSKLEEQRAEQILRQMRARYLTPEARRLIKQGFDQDWIRGLHRNRTLTWLG